MTSEHIPVNQGSLHHNSKLTEADVYLMRELAEEARILRKKLKGLTREAIAEKFDVDKATADDAIMGRTWRHVRFPGETS